MPLIGLKYCLTGFFLFIFCVGTTGFSLTAYASCPGTCVDADILKQGQDTQKTVEDEFATLEENVQNSIVDRLTAHMDHTEKTPAGSYITFLTDTFYQQMVLPTLQLFTQQMASVGLHQLAIIGSFFDAEQALNTQRTSQILHHQAHKDYQPSHSFCTIGTSVRSLAVSESLSRDNRDALTQVQMKRDLGHTSYEAARSRDIDITLRWKRFREHHCDPKDNRWNTGNPELSGMAQVCETATDADAKKRYNIDIDYTRLIDLPRTLEASFHDETPAPDELDIQAFGEYLFGHDVLSRQYNRSALGGSTALQQKYFTLRSIAARRNVAQSSFNAIVGLKASGDTGETQAGNSAAFMAAALTELGIDGNIEDMIGTNPSYYAQLEMLSKTLYQNPDFFANLYDKPANVARKSVAMKAIELMLDRALYESQSRQEVALSVLLSTQLKDNFPSQFGRR